MSYFYSKPFAAENRFADLFDRMKSTDDRSASKRSADGAIDHALRNVPLPNGLLKRLGKLVYTLREEAPDRVDYRGV
jgi:hypothetical protein